MFSYKGAIHIHTKLSDGTGDINSISRAAKKAGLDFIIITDHNHYDTDEGILNGVYVIKAQEISPQKCNHYLAFDLDETILPEDNPEIYVNKVREKGGFGFAAHPDEGNYIDYNGDIFSRKNSNHCIPWTDKRIKPDGVEIWNWFSIWADNLNDRSLLTLAYGYLFKHNIVTPPSRATLEWWDKLNSESNKIVPAIGGVDAHALKIYKYIIPLTVFPYLTSFKTITNYIYLNQELNTDFTKAKEQIINAIKNGNNIIANRHISKNIPEIFVTNSNGKYFTGEYINLDDKCTLHFVSNEPMEICLIYNGNVIKNGITNNYVYRINRCGKYRVEVSHKGKRFLYTNPFNIV